MSATHESCMNAQEVADLLRIKNRTFLERRHSWNPPFPPPILRRPLIFRSRDAHQWIVEAADRAQIRSRR